MTDALKQAWNGAFPNIPPIAYRLRTLLGDRWVRFHRLPESKRYADSESEQQTILLRHNQILDELAERPNLFLITTAFVGNEKPSASPQLEDLELLALDPCTVLVYCADARI